MESTDDAQTPESTDDESTDGVRTLDVRDVPGEPFGEITSALDDLPADETLVLVNSFEPAPLYAVLEDRGFTYESEQVAPDEWHVTIEHA